VNPKPRILLIDDSEATVDGIKTFLDERYEVFTATNGIDGGGGPQNLDSVLSSDSDPNGRIRDEQET